MAAPSAVALTASTRITAAKAVRLVLQKRAKFTAEAMMQLTKITINRAMAAMAMVEEALMVDSVN